MKSDKNYFVCNRSLFKNPFWYAEKFTKGQAWVDLFGNANHSDGWFEKNNQRVDVKRGQTGRSIESLAEDWKWSRNKVKRFLKRLKDDLMIDHKTNHLTSIITICNYDKFQFTQKQNEPSNELPDELPHEPSDELQTIKNKLIKNKGITEAPEFKDFEISENLLNWAKSKNILNGNLEKYIEECLIWHGAKGNKYKNWDKTIQNWILKDLKMNPKIEQNEFHYL